MNQIVTFTGLETKTGANDSGGWTLYLFKDAGGNKFQTFDDDLGHAGQKLIGQSVEVEYEVQTRDLPAKGDRPATTVNNNVLKSLREASETATDKPDPVNAPAQSFSSDRPIRSHETNRSDALGHAVAKVGPEHNNAQELFALADAFTRYIETGDPAKAEAPDEIKF